MKKLINLIEVKSTISSMNLSNVYVDSDSSQDEVSKTLLLDINLAARKAGVKVTVTSITSGHRTTTSSDNLSRHVNGNAVDISLIDNISYKSNPNRFKTLGDKLYKELKNLGYDSSGSETGQDKSVIWQTDGHKNHIHVSIKDDKVEPSVGKEVGTSYRDKAKDMITNLLIKTMGMNESKQERILKDIEKIKNLL